MAYNSGLDLLPGAVLASGFLLFASVGVGAENAGDDDEIIDQIVVVANKDV